MSVEKHERRQPPLGAPLPISVPDDTFDLRVVLLTADFVLDPVWEGYRAACGDAVAGRRDHRALVPIALGAGVAGGDDKMVVLDPAQPRAADLVVQTVLLQACRLLSQRPRTAGLATRGAAPIKLFLSHTKRDKVGLKIARALKDYLDDTTTDRFFDDVSIQPGDGISGELEESIDESALVAIRTDGYVASPWCRLELALAKRNRRPMVVVDALSGSEARSSPYLGNIASVRVDPAGIPDAQLDRTANFIGLEVLRFLHADTQLNALKAGGIVPDDAVLLARPPELRDLVTLAAQARVGARAPVFVHPDPVFSQDEIEEFKSFGVNFKTPVSVWSRRLGGLRLGLSVGGGDKGEEAALGLSPLHIEDATRAMARQALAAGATLVYGGRLNAPTPEASNLTEALYEMIGAYNQADAPKLGALVNYTPWPWHQDVDVPWLAARRASLQAIACDPPSGIAAGDDGPGHAGRLAGTPEGRHVLACRLSLMRQRIAANTDARIVLGGNPHSFMGRPTP